MGILNKNRNRDNRWSDDEDYRFKKRATIDDFTIGICSDNSVVVLINGEPFDGINKQILSNEIAPLVGFSVDPRWTTQQIGSKLVDFINGNNSTQKSKTNKKGSGKSKKTRNMAKTRNYQALYQFLRNVVYSQCSIQGRNDIINIMHSIANNINNRNANPVAGYTMQRNILTRLFITTSGTQQYTRESIMLRLTTLDALYSTNASKSYYAIEEMADWIWNLPGNGTPEDNANSFFNEAATGVQFSQNGVNIDNWFNKQFGIQKNGKTGHRKTSLLSKYAYYCLLLDPYSDGFPIYDSLAVASFPFAFKILWPGNNNNRQLKKLVKAFSSESTFQGAIPISLYIEAMKALCDGLRLQSPFQGFKKFDILDAYLWRMGKLSNGNLSLLLDKQGYEGVLTILGLKYDPANHNTMSNYFNSIALNNNNILNVNINTYNNIYHLFVANNYPTICDNKVCTKILVNDNNGQSSGDVNALILFSLINNAQNNPNIFINQQYLNVIYQHWRQYYMH